MRIMLIASAALLTALAGATRAQASENLHGRSQAPLSSLTAPGAYTIEVSSPPDEKEMAFVHGKPLYTSAGSMSRDERRATRESSQALVDGATIAATAARRPEATTQMTQAQSQPQQVASAKASGTVNSVDAGGRKVNVTHGPIPQIGWPGMTMDFAVSDKVDLKTVRPGDKVEFILRQGSGGMYSIDSISK